MAKNRYMWRDVLVLGNKDIDRRTLRKYFLEYCKEKHLPYRCAVEECLFHSNPLIWNGDSFELDLDHKNGNRFDNRPQNLRFLCPICHSQEPTRGGSNRGRVSLLADPGEEPTGKAFSIRNDDDTVDFTYESTGEGFPMPTGAADSSHTPTTTPENCQTENQPPEVQPSDDKSE